MDYFFKKIAVILILISSLNLFAQNDDIDLKIKTTFKPKFTLGSGFYSLVGDVKNDQVGLLKGKVGYSAGMKFPVLNNLDLSFLVLKNAFSADNGEEKFSSDLNGFGIGLLYNFNQISQNSKVKPILLFGIQRFGVSTIINDEKKDRENALTIPFGLGFAIDITERLEFDVSINYAFGINDIDMSMIKENNSDGYRSLNFAIHYDLFSPSKPRPISEEESYYSDVDFAKLEMEDEDGDLVPDLDDYCPQTPIGVEVDKYGCPYDNDNDGIANYLDLQKNTPKGAIVDENGVQLKLSDYKSMYTNFEIASRKYANFYNEVEINREDYKNIDEYLIAKANAFNKAFNESIDNNVSVLDLIYRVKIGEYKQGIDAKTTNKLLSLDDLESLTQKNDVVIYAVGQYNNFSDANDRLYQMKNQGFEDAIVIVDNNGIISNYLEDEKLLDSIIETNIEENLNFQSEITVFDDYEIDEVVVKDEDLKTNEITYRIQIGAFNNTLSEKIFIGVDNVISFTGKDGLIRYMAGSFINFNDAIEYKAEMIARGFEDAFIVTYKNGKRVSLDVAIKTVNTNIPPIDSQIQASDINFTVQIMVAESTVSASDLQKMSKLDFFTKKATGSDFFEYYAGTYSNYSDAIVQLEKARSAGFVDSFIFATKQGQRITLEEAKELLR